MLKDVQIQYIHVHTTFVIFHVLFSLMSKAESRHPIVPLRPGSCCRAWSTTQREVGHGTSSLGFDNVMHFLEGCAAWSLWMRGAKFIIFFQLRRASASCNFVYLWVVELSAVLWCQGVGC